ncbi:MAG: GNAT family N-acetyltransferase [Candidatus Bathyarchaeota archaeon]|nr:MAG: GNAT family N-acetyltransferase [Candidatus Bathyarchaeota archaeon]
MVVFIPEEAERVWGIETSIRNLRIQKASLSDVGEMVRWALAYHAKEPEVRKTLSSPLKSLHFTLWLVYNWFKCYNFKAVVSNRMAGYLQLRPKAHDRVSIHIWDIVVHPRLRGKGIGTSLMKFAEKTAQSKHQYLTLGVIESNAPARRLYRKLGYRNLQGSPTCFKITEIPEDLRVSSKVEFKLISGEKAVSCRNRILLDAVESVLGIDERKTFQSVYLSSNLDRKSVQFRIVVSTKEAGYVSIKQKRNVKSVFFVLHPSLWNTDVEIDVTKLLIDRIREGLVGPIKICVVQAYEKSLSAVLSKIECRSERAIGRLGLIKKLSGNRLKST